MRSSYTGVLAIALLSALIYLLMRIATLPLESGEAYPAYSSLRADPRGTLALYESLAALGELRVTRNFQPLPKLKSTPATLLLLGEPYRQAATWSEEELKFYESLADQGARLVIAFLPEPPETSARKQAGSRKLIPAIISRWHLAAETYHGTDEEAEKAGSMPRDTWAYFDPADKSGWRVLETNDQDDPTLIERDFGKGQIVLLTESYPLSNEGLRAGRNVDLIELLAGSNQQIVFDESHLGVANTGSVGALIRRYRLTGAFAVMLLLGLLFLWKNSTSLIPRAAEPEVSVALGADAQSGLINLLKRSVSVDRVAQTCWERWIDTRALGRPISDQRVALAARELSAANLSLVAIYKNIHDILTEKT